MDLVIVESPTKARTLKKFLGKDYAVEASMGHVRDLPKSKMGVEVDNGFEPTYETVKGKGKVVTKLKKLAKEAGTVYLAMDPDREGEAIAFHVKELVEGKKKTEKKYKRVTFHEITKGAIEEAMKKPGSVNIALVDAQQARRVLDRLVGYSLSPVLWKKVRRGLSAGRVQSVALRLMVEREAEIEAFKTQEYWDIRAKLKTENSKLITNENFDEVVEGELIAQLWEIEGKRVVVKGSDQDKGKAVVYVDSKKEAEAIVGELEKASYLVESVERAERKRNPYAPFTTSTLQQAAANVLGWSGKQTMRIAQQLYEAGLITYHRTDSTALAVPAVQAIRQFVGDTYGQDYLPQKPRIYKTSSKNAQEAHEAIRPTDVLQKSVEGVSGKVTASHEKLYLLVWRRAVASQMRAAIYDQTSVVIRAKNSRNFGLRASGSIQKFAGWRVVYEKKNGDNELPNVVQNEGLELVAVDGAQKETLPPPRYNDASLVKELEKRGIGRPSTYAPIISVLTDRGYVERLDRRFYPTAVGKTVIEFLMKHFSAVMDYDFTAEMEEDLDRVARDEKDWKKVMAEFWKPFNEKIEKAEDADRVAIPVEETGKLCPTCKEGQLVIRSGRFGKFLSCSLFPDCKHTEALVEKLDDFPCPECQSDVVMKRTRKGRTFWGCSAYPKCDWASWQDPRKK
jgi:DNA topoisomerase I